MKTKYDKIDFIVSGILLILLGMLIMAIIYPYIEADKTIIDNDKLIEQDVCENIRIPFIFLDWKENSNISKVELDPKVTAEGKDIFCKKYDNHTIVCSVMKTKCHKEKEVCKEVCEEYIVYRCFDEGAYIGAFKKEKLTRYHIEETNCNETKEEHNCKTICTIQYEKEE